MWHCKYLHKFNCFHFESNSKYINIKPHGCPTIILSMSIGSHTYLSHICILYMKWRATYYNNRVRSSWFGNSFKWKRFVDNMKASILFEIYCLHLTFNIRVYHFPKKGCFKYLYNVTWMGQRWLEISLKTTQTKNRFSFTQKLLHMNLNQKFSKRFCHFWYTLFITYLT